MDTRIGRNQQHSTNSIEIRMAATPVWIPVARSVAEGLAGRANFDGDATCDVRLAVDEACAAVANQTAEGAMLTCAFIVEPGRMDIEVSGAAATEPAPFGALAWRILRAVTDELVLRHKPGHLVSIRMAKHM
jgi:serine/threonine-protein kinase RsbW